MVAKCPGIGCAPYSMLNLPSSADQSGDVKMSFLDKEPSFPYQSSEAKQLLGIPDSPAIHLAITSLAKSLLPLADGHDVPPRHVRIAALRSASGGVLFLRSLLRVQFEFLSTLGLPAAHITTEDLMAADATDWLRQAIEQLKNKGIAVPDTILRQATSYGWTSG